MPGLTSCDDAMKDWHTIPQSYFVIMLNEMLEREQNLAQDGQPGPKSEAGKRLEKIIRGER
jgi:hypothetical protein